MKKIVIVLLILGVLGGSAWFFLSQKDSKTEAEQSQTVQHQTDNREPKRSLKKRIKGRTPSKPQTAEVVINGKKMVVEVEDDDEVEMTPEEEKLNDRIDDAYQADDLKTLFGMVAEAKACPNKEVRRSMVDALAYFGEKALPELTQFLSDPDGDVAESAMDSWKSALGDIENEKTKADVVTMGMSIIKDEDALEDISNELIGIDEEVAVRALLAVMTTDNEPGVAKAREQYEFVTGEEFTNAADAEKWIRENKEN